MRVTWVTFQRVKRNSAGELTSDTASVRYRVLSPIRHMLDHRHRIVLAPRDAAQIPEDALDADVVVFSKSFSQANEAFAERAKARGLAVVFDVCDDHYERPDLGEHYRRMTAMADVVVANTPEMAEAAGPYATEAPVVIADPYEGPRGAPVFQPGEPLKLLWFGHQTNLDTLHHLSELCALSQPMSLTVLTQPVPQLEPACRQLASAAPNLRVTARTWSLDQQWAELAACDAVVVPTLQTSRKLVKSANRVVESLWAGRPVVAQPLPAYAPFSAWTPVRPSLLAGLRELLAQADEAPGRIAAAQQYIETVHGPAGIGARWRSVLEGLHAKGGRPE